jgi:hypothetical protein
MSTRLLRLAAKHPAAVESARHEAQHFIEYRTSGGLSMRCSEQVLSVSV